MGKFKISNWPQLFCRSSTKVNHSNKVNSSSTYKPVQLTWRDETGGRSFTDVETEWWAGKKWKRWWRVGSTALTGAEPGQTTELSWRPLSSWAPRRATEQLTTCHVPPCASWVSMLAISLGFFLQCLPLQLDFQNTDCWEHKNHINPRFVDCVRRRRRRIITQAHFTHMNEAFVR